MCASRRVQEGSEGRVERAVKVPNVDKVGEDRCELGASQQRMRGIKGRDDGGQEVLYDGQRRVGNAFIVLGGDTKLEDGDLLDDTLYLLNTCELLIPAP